TLRGNDFTGPIPFINALAALQVVDLGDNALTGEIPPALDRLRFLEQLLLDGNQLTGAVPPALANVTTLTRLLLHDNFFDALPVLTTLPALNTVNVARNRLTFEDIEPNITLAGGAIAYAPQDTVATSLARTATTVTFSVSVGGANNRYQWFRDGEAVDGATADTLAVDAAMPVAAYHCEITNTVATLLTLVSRPVRSDAVAPGLDEAPEAAPASFALHANYPNPFNPSTQMAFDVAAPSRVRLTVYDLLGRAVATLVDGAMPAGRHQAVFDAAGLPSGLYLYRIEMGDFRAARTMLLVK
ncbi:MAG: T9SS type A sorting domain-containing protein, partial [Rhodothermales bacterium]